MKRILFFLFLSCILSSCDKDQSISSYKDTYHDDSADITYIGSHFYTTNIDLSRNAGSQIDLFQFSSDGAIIEDVFDLNMNGQGYFALTNDGKNLYLQSKTYNSLLICSPVGELIYHDWFVLDPSCKASGICYDDDADSLVFLFKEIPSSNQYCLQYYGIDQLFEPGRKVYKEWVVFDTNVGALAIEYKDSSFYVLGNDTMGSNILLITDVQLNIQSVEIIPDSIVVGMCFKEDDLYLSYRDRRIKFWKQY